MHAIELLPQSIRAALAAAAEHGGALPSNPRYAEAAVAAVAALAGQTRRIRTWTRPGARRKGTPWKK